VSARSADLLIAGALAVALAATSWWTAAQIGPAVLAYNDCWFEADILRVYLNMSNRFSDQWRISEHPLFSLLAFPPVKTLHWLGLEVPLAVRAVIAGTAAIWIASLFGLLRLVGCRRGDTVLCSLMGALSAASLFWFAVPETYSFGSVSIIWALTLVALSQHRRVPEPLFVAVSALTLSFTITNWMAGIVAAAATHPWRRAVQLTVNAFCVVVILWAVEAELFPKVPFFLTAPRDEHGHTLPVEAGGPGIVARAFIYHGMVMPAFKVSEPREVRRPRLNVQASSLGSGGTWGLIATGLWTGLLGLGAWAIVTIRPLRSFRLALTAILVGQLTLHGVYGAETFLYSLHWLPLLVALAALGTLTSFRPLVLLLAAGLVLTLAVNNVGQFLDAARTVRLHPISHPGSEIYNGPG
jgi:hypothetical protein